MYDHWYDPVNGTNYTLREIGPGGYRPDTGPGRIVCPGDGYGCIQPITHVLLSTDRGPLISHYGMLTYGDSQSSMDWVCDEHAAQWARLHTWPEVLRDG